MNPPDNEFAVGDRVETLSGMTKGTILEISEEGNLDIQGDTGNKYRNCMPFSWKRSIEPPKAIEPKPIARGDLCHIYYDFGDGKIWHRNGYVISARTVELFVMFNDLDSHWIAREYCVRGHGENPV